MRGDEPCGKWCDHLMKLLPSATSQHTHVLTRIIQHSAQVRCVIVLSSMTKPTMWSSQRTFSRCLGPCTWKLRHNCLPAIALTFQTEKWVGGREGGEEFGGSSISASPLATSNRHEWTAQIIAVILPLEYTRTPYSNVVMVEEWRSIITQHHHP